MRSILLLACFSISGFAVFGQERPVQLDEFGPVTNDALMARVEYFANEILEKNSDGFAILRGPPLMKYLMRRKIEGCLRWRGRPIDQLKFVYGEDREDLRVYFWKVPKGSELAPYSDQTFDYRLPQLKAPVELSSSSATDEYCPIYFDIDWYSKFLVANPSLRGKVVIDTSKSDFLKRVVKYRKRLASLGVQSSRVSFLRHKFEHERDEQWWLIPPT